MLSIQKKHSDVCFFYLEYRSVTYGKCTNLFKKNSNLFIVTDMLSVNTRNKNKLTVLDNSPYKDANSFKGQCLLFILKIYNLRELKLW